MLETIGEAPATILDRTTYHAQRRRETLRLTGPVWELERSQFFHEPADDPSWQAFIAGKWDRVLAAFESERQDARAEAERYAGQGSELRRLRVVEHPVSPYLKWEMHWFKILWEEGIAIRVVDAESIREWERGGSLPEVVVDEHALYHVSYDEHWKACGTRRIDDPVIVRGASEEIARLWAEGEPFPAYFQREIAPLSPPTANG